MLSTGDYPARVRQRSYPHKGQPLVSRNFVKDNDSLSIEILVIWRVEYGQVGEIIIYPYLARISSSCWRQWLALQLTQCLLCEASRPQRYRCSLERLIAICAKRANFVNNGTTSTAFQLVFEERLDIAGGCRGGKFETRMVCNDGAMTATVHRFQHLERCLQAHADGKQ